LDRIVAFVVALAVLIYYVVIISVVVAQLSLLYAAAFIAVRGRRSLRSATNRGHKFIVVVGFSVPLDAL